MSASVRISRNKNFVLEIDCREIYLTPQDANELSTALIECGAQPEQPNNSAMVQLLQDIYNRFSSEVQLCDGDFESLVQSIPVVLEQQHQ